MGERPNYDTGIRKYMYIWIFFMIVLQGMALAFPMLLFFVTNTISGSIERVNQGETQGTIIGEILFWSALVFVFIVLIMVISFISEFYGFKYADKYQRNMRKELFAKFQRVSTQTIEKYGQSKVLPIVMNDTIWMKNYRRRIVNAIVFIPFGIFGPIVMMFTLSVSYALIALAAIPIFALFFFLYTRKMAKIMPPAIDALDEYFLNIKDGIAGARDIRILGKADERSDAFEQHVITQRKQGLQAERGVNMSPAIISLIFTLITVVIIIYGANFNMQTAADLVVLNTILQYITQVQVGSHTLFIWFFDHIPRVRLTQKRFDDVYALPEEPLRQGLQELQRRPEPRLELTNVSYLSSNGSKVLKDLDISVPFDTRIAVAGGIGSGKNVLSKLLLQHSYATEGIITLNGIGIDSIAPSYWRREFVSYCDPNPKFIQGTIRENIQLMSPGITDEEIRWVFQDLGAPDLLDLDMVLSERITLNESAQNLLNIVRAVCKPAYIYIFDQCFEHVHPTYIRNLMRRLKTENKTALFITYDSNVCRACNKVYILKNGKIAGEGRHAALIAENAEYRKFYAAGSGTIIMEEEITEVTGEETSEAPTDEEVISHA